MPKIISRKEAKEKSLKKYFLNIPCIHGHISERYVSSKMCITCSLIRDNNHYKDKSKTILTRRKNLYSLDVRNYISEWNKGNSKPFWKKRLGIIKSRAKKKNLDFNLTADYLVQLTLSQKFLCHYTKFYLVPHEGKSKKIELRLGTLSVDRIDSSKGYIKGNIRLISDLVNTIKQNMTEDEMFGLLTLILSNVEDKYKNDNTKITEYKKRNQTTLKYR